MTTIAVIGLGYVGLPLATAFARKHRTIGFDISSAKIKALSEGIDPAGQIDTDTLRSLEGKIEFTHDATRISAADFIVIAVPTPVDQAHNPDFGPLIGASQIAGSQMRPGSIVIYESTVYPGATEEVCIPVLERHSGLKWRQDFHVGYSPERINPGDRQHTLASIVKVVAGDDEPTLSRVDDLYSSIVQAGTFRASSIKVAEAAKVIENTQRDLNIALMNELAIIFDRLDVDTTEVLRAAGTKWNFIPFRPGLVGGHCIGVDPYYLTHKAEMVGYHPQVILAGRRINDGMGKFIAEKTVKTMLKAGSPILGASVNVLGLTFKENCADLRNSRVVDVIAELQDYGCQVSVHDPLADPTEADSEYGIRLCTWEAMPRADALVVCVAHENYLNMRFEEILQKVKRPGGSFIDVKSAFDLDMARKTGLIAWRL
jgi:UDP-N-acetyl-D-galactosamine dehydrogenase